LTDLPKLAGVSNTSANYKQAGQPSLIRYLFWFSFADPSHIQLHIKIWAIGQKRLFKKYASTKIYPRKNLHKKMWHFQGHCFMTMRQVLAGQISGKAGYSTE